MDFVLAVTFKIFIIVDPKSMPRANFSQVVWDYFSLKIFPCLPPYVPSAVWICNIAGTAKVQGGNQPEAQGILVPVVPCHCRALYGDEWKTRFFF